MLIKLKETVYNMRDFASIWENKAANSNKSEKGFFFLELMTQRGFSVVESCQALLPVLKNEGEEIDLLYLR